MYWLLGLKSEPTTSNKLLVYKTIPKPIWKTLLMIVDAPWFVPNTVIRRDLQTPTIKKEIAETPAK
jgi:hypothetical protein